VSNHPSNDRKHPNPSAGCVSAWSVCLHARLPMKQLAMKMGNLLVVLAFLVGFSANASARCGSSSRHMPWRNATGAEIIHMDASVFIPKSASKQLPAFSLDSGMSHDEDRPCSSCRCKNEKEPGIPMETISGDSPISPICRFAEASMMLRSSLLGGRLAILCDSFLSPWLGLLERPPRVLCA